MAHARTNFAFTRTFPPFKLEPNIRLKLIIHNLPITKNKVPIYRERFMIPDKLRITFPKENGCFEEDDLNWPLTLKTLN